MQKWTKKCLQNNMTGQYSVLSLISFDPIPDPPNPPILPPLILMKEWHYPKNSKHSRMETMAITIMAKGVYVTGWHYHKHYLILCGILQMLYNSFVTCSIPLDLLDRIIVSAWARELLGHCCLLNHKNTASTLLTHQKR